LRSWRRQSARSRLGRRQEEIAQLLAAGITEEMEAREKALRSGYPAKAGGKSRELRLELEDLQDQIGDVTRMKARLELERLGLEKEQADERFREAQAVVEEILPRFQAVEAELTQAHTIATNIGSGRHTITQQISRARQNLWNVDALYREQQQREIEERRQQIEEGMQRQREEQAEAFNAAAEATNPPQIQVN